MTPSSLHTSSTLRLPGIYGAGHNGSHGTRRLLLRGCDIVVLDNQLTAYRNMAPGSVPPQRVPKNPAIRQALRRQPARLGHNPIARDAGLWEQSPNLTNPYQKP